MKDAVYKMKPNEIMRLMEGHKISMVLIKESVLDQKDETIADLKEELAKYQSIKIDVEDRSTWPPVNEYFLSINGFEWDLNLIENHDDLINQCSNFEYWKNLPPLPKEISELYEK